MNITTIRKQLNNRQAELLARLNRLTEDSRHTQRLPADFAEQAVELENDDVLLNLDEATRTEIQQIRRAIERLDAGQYGLCDACHQPIAPERLEALPYATRCRKCAARCADMLQHS